MSIHGPYDTDNIFAKILSREMPAAMIATSSRTVAFMDAFPQSRGHCLVLPKMASRNLLEMTRKDLSAVTDQVQVIAKAMEKALKPDGITITQFNGSPAGQTVFHTHFHIIPHYEGTPLAGHGPNNGAGKMADMAELKAIAAEIRKEMP